MKARMFASILTTATLVFAHFVFAEGPIWDNACTRSK